MKTIPCPIHPTGRVRRWSLHKHEAVLWQSGERWAGQWECLMTGRGDSCEHDNRVVESVYVDDWPTPDVDMSYSVDTYVCADCGKQIPLDEANPAEDV